MIAALELLIFLPAAIFAGIVLFLATVIAKSTSSLSSKSYHALFSEIIRNGRESYLIKGLVLLPLIGLIVLLILRGSADITFLSGAILFVFGSFGLSRLANEPIYNQLLSTDPDNTEAINAIRHSLNRSNGFRALFSVLGVVTMGFSYAV